MARKFVGDPPCKASGVRVADHCVSARYAQSVVSSVGLGAIPEHVVAPAVQFPDYAAAEHIGNSHPHADQSLGSELDSEGFELPVKLTFRPVGTAPVT